VADQHLADGANNYEACLEYGRVIELNTIKGANIHKRAANQDHPGAQW
jgi:TPR repeat protein